MNYTNLRIDLGECQACSCLSVHNTAQSSLALDNAVWNAHLPAQGWEEQYNLKGTRNSVSFAKLCEILVHMLNHFKAWMKVFAQS